MTDSLKRAWVPAEVRMVQVKQAIRDLNRRNKAASVRNIAREIGLKSPASVHRYLRMLRAAGTVERTSFGHYVLVRRRRS